MVQLKNVNFTVYLVVCIFKGFIFSTLSPIILYYAKVTRRDQTYFSFLFFAKAIGIVIGFVLSKVLPRCFTYHNILVISTSFCGAGLICSSLDLGFWNLSITMIVIGASSVIFQIICNLCIFEAFPQNNFFWVQLSNISMAVGGIVGPFIAIYTQQLTFRAIGILFFMLQLPLLILPSPQNQQQKQSEIEKKGVQIPKKYENGLCLIMLIYVGLMFSYPNWLPIYAIKSGQFNESSANIIVSIFGIAGMIGRIFKLAQKGKSSERLIFNSKLWIICGIVTIIIQWFQYFKILCYFSVIASGLVLSGSTGLIFTSFSEHGYTLSAEGIANMTLCSILGEGLFLGVIGYLMAVFGFKSFVYSVFVISVIMFAVIAYINKSMEEYIQENPRHEEAIQN